MKRLFVFHFILVLTALPLLVRSQIVNIERQRLDTAQKGWVGNLEGHLHLTENGQRILEFGTSEHIQFNRAKYTFLILNEMNLIQSEGNSLINNGFQHIRYNYDLSKTHFFRWEVFAQSQYNKIQKIKQRIITGTGLRYTWGDLDTLTTTLGGSIMYEHERLESDLGEESLIRVNSYLLFGYQLSEDVGFQTTTYFQPSLADLGDFRISHESELKIGLTTKLSFKLVYNLIYDSDPPEGVRNSNYGIRNALSYSF